jgi:hypothetical protein
MNVLLPFIGGSYEKCTSNLRVGRKDRQPTGLNGAFHRPVLLGQKGDLWDVYTPDGLELRPALQPPRKSKWRHDGGLTVKLSGRLEAHDQAPRAHNLFSARGADTQAVHGPLQRLLGTKPGRTYQSSIFQDAAPSRCRIRTPTRSDGAKLTAFTASVVLRCFVRYV